MCKISNALKHMEARNGMVFARSWGRGRQEVVLQWVHGGLGSRGLLYNVVPRASSSAVSCTSNFVKRADLMLPVLITTCLKKEL